MRSDFHEMTGLDRVHFVGIGGSGMSGIAEVLLDLGVKVTGSDLAQSEATDRLEQLGAEIAIGHAGERVAGAQLVVKSSAVPDDNPEIAAARDRGIPVIRRAEMLSELMRLKYGIAVAGTHGKTTTTSLVGSILTEAGLDPTVIVGGRLRELGTGARIGRSQYLVCEADEYDRSFLRLHPVVAVITSIDIDHLDTYGNLEGILAAFTEFAGSVPFFGQLIACLDDRNIQGLLPRFGGRRIVTYGLSPQADLVATAIHAAGPKVRFTVRHAEDGELGEVELPLVGEHNVRNALAAIAVARALGLPFSRTAEGLAAFEGVHRRFEHLGEWRGAVVVDDYAHHPAEVEATLRAARAAYPQQRILAVFQPHLYSRTREHAEGFGRALLFADRAWVTGIYGSREEPIEGVGGELVVESAQAAGHRGVTFVEDWHDLPEVLAREATAGDVVITLGAGDIYRLARQLSEEEA